MQTSTAAAAKKLVVTGGNGFLGSRICRSAVLRGWDVTSISRSGEPRWKVVTGSPTRPSWANKVAWERADIFRPETYAPLLNGANYIAHSLGILLEADYKGIVSGQESPLQAVSKILGGQKPSAAAAASSSSPSSSSARQMSYNAMNRDTAVLVARAAADAGVDAFAYISAAASPVLPARYIGSKREAEQLLSTAASSSSSSSSPALHRPIFIRAPMLYDAAARPMMLPLAAMAGAGAVFDRLSGGVLGRIAGAGMPAPLKADAVADAVIEALSDESVSGAVEVGEISKLAETAWRKSML